MKKWTDDNTEGFSADDLAELNEAQLHLEARFPGIDPQNLADMLNNAFTPEADARQMERTVARLIEAKR